MEPLRGLVERARRRPSWVLDAVLVLLVAIARVVQVEVDSGHEPAATGVVLLGVTVLGASPLFLRRRFPFAVLIAVSLVELALVLADVHGPPLALLVATYSAAAYCSRALALLVLVGGLALLTIVLVAFVEPEFVIETHVAFVMAWALGALQRSRRDHAAETTRRLELMERGRARERVIAVAEERARIARELHDVIAHGIGVMVLQAGAARRSLSPGNEKALESIGEVERTGRQSLAEMRRLLGLLGDGEPAEFAPQPGLARLDELVEGYRRADVPVELRVEGTTRPVPSGVDLSAYRIVQEALTNVVKHAGQVPVNVTLRYERDNLRIEVANRGNGRPPSWPPGASSGRGLIGMSERVSLLGGTLDAGPGSDGGFCVSCVLPLSGG
jgi:signal transduction histidine kinase